MRDIAVFFRDSVSRFDFIAWGLVIPFFLGSALLNNGDAGKALLGAVGIILAMFFIGSAVEILIATMRGMKNIGTIVGFLTNGPEMLVLIIGLVNNDIIFAASTPLGSNPMNILLLLIAAALSRKLQGVFRLAPVYAALTFGLTIGLAFSFFAIDEGLYLFWVGLVALVTALLFLKRPDDPPEDLEGEEAVAKRWFVPALLCLVLAGFALDGVVEYASKASQAPKGIIGFIVLSTLTSWPEFKSCLTLFRRNMSMAALLNIIVSNITNLWLAAIGVVYYLLLR